MTPSMELVSIPESGYSDYRYEVIFRGYKWDPQVEDHNTISKHVLVMDRATAEQLARWSEALARETAAMEAALLQDPSHLRQLGLPKDIRRALTGMPNGGAGDHVRLMRFDFHPTETGWAISEVNSDVPGGLAEASVLPDIALGYLPGFVPYERVADHLLSAFDKRLPQGGRIAFVHATSYADDRQVMQFLADHFAARGYRCIMTAPDLIDWPGQAAMSLLHGEGGPIDGIVRFFPAEWLPNLPKSAHWRGFFGTSTPSCNHPMAMLTQSKRLPLVWDRLPVDIPTWRALLPETVGPRHLPKGGDWIYKPALGRVGEGISIRGAAPEKELKGIAREARRYPRDWVAQRRFQSRPLVAGDGIPYHLCVGVFTVDGACAGFYGRMSPHPRIDARAIDIPILIRKEGANHA